MSTLTRPATQQNGNLVESFMPAEVHNKLSYIADRQDAPAQHKNPLRVLLRFIQRSGLREEFLVYLLHKHYDALKSSIMVCESFVAPEHPPFMLFSPRPPQDVPEVRGLYFQAQTGGKMRAYEYTTDAGVDVSAHAKFVSDFSDLCFDLGVQDIFALAVRGPMDTVVNGIEWPQYGSTILFPESLWLPAESDVGQQIVTTLTDWSAPSDDSMLGITTLKCTATRKNHYNFTCNSSRRRMHHRSDSYQLGGIDVLLDTDMFKIFEAASRAIVVY